MQFGWPLNSSLMLIYPKLYSESCDFFNENLLFIQILSNGYGPITSTTCLHPGHSACRQTCCSQVSQVICWCNFKALCGYHNNNILTDCLRIDFELLQALFLDWHA